MAETNEDPPAEGREDPVDETTEDSARRTGEAAAAETRNVVVAETGDDSVALTGEDHPMAMDFENLQTLGNGRVEAAAPAAGSFSESFQMVAAEVTDYSKKSLESVSAFVDKLRRAKSWESAMQIQSDYANSAYAEFVTYLGKMSDLYCNLFKRASTPIENAAAKIAGVKT